MTTSILPLRVDGLSFEAGRRRLLDRVSFELVSGTRSVILGPNGAGKSLMLRLCHGLIEPSAGSVSWAVPDTEARMGQAMVFQKPVMLRRTAAANLAYPLACRGVQRRTRRKAVADMLDRTGLAPLARTPARVLSAGEQQRLALARAWILKPEVLFLDEPTASLDPASTRAVEEMIVAIGAAGAKIVLTTQDLGQARRIADDVLFLHRGRLLENAPADRFFAQPDTGEARAFIAGELMPQGDIDV